MSVNPCQTADGTTDPGRKASAPSMAMAPEICCCGCLGMTTATRSYGQLPPGTGVPRGIPRQAGRPAVVGRCAGRETRARGRGCYRNPERFSAWAKSAGNAGYECFGMNSDEHDSASETRKRPGRGGNVPPAPLFEKGNTASPGRPKNLGLSIRERMNEMAEWTEDQVRRVARKASTPVNQRIAAERILMALDVGDLADFEEYLAGETNLRDLRKTRPTAVIKRASTRIRVHEDGRETVEREIELHDRSAQAFGNLMDRTLGRIGPAPDPTATGPIDVTIQFPEIPWPTDRSLQKSP